MAGRPITGFAATFVVLSSLACGHQSQSLKRVDRIVIVKSAHTLTLMSGGEILRVYKVALGRNPVGPKTHTDDHKTPEGEYFIDAKKPNSRFYRALHISYPNQADKVRASRIGLDPGGDVEIHGIEKGLGWIGRLQRRVDWTDGCIAVTDSEIDEIYNSVAIGTPVEIKP